MKRIYTKTVLLTLCALFMGCGSQHIKLSKAEYYNWSAGIANGGSGSEYTLFVEVLQTGARIDSMWVNGEVLNAIIPSTPGKVSADADLKNIKAQKGTTIKIRASGSRFSKDKQTQLPIKNFEGVAVLRYYVGDKAYYLPISSLTEIQTTKRQ